MLSIFDGQGHLLTRSWWSVVCSVTLFSKLLHFTFCKLWRHYLVSTLEIFWRKKMKMKIWKWKMKMKMKMKIFWTFFLELFFWGDFFFDSIDYFDSIVYSHLLLYIALCIVLLFYSFTLLYLLVPYSKYGYQSWRGISPRTAEGTPIFFRIVQNWIRDTMVLFRRSEDNGNTPKKPFTV